MSAEAFGAKLLAQAGEESLASVSPSHPSVRSTTGNRAFTCRRTPLLSVTSQINACLLSLAATLNDTSTMHLRKAQEISGEPILIYVSYDQDPLTNTTNLAALSIS